MKTIVLSDYIGDQQRVRAAARDREYTAAREGYEAALQRHEDELRRRQQAFTAAYRARSVWGTILCFFSYVFFLFNTGPRAPLLIRKRQAPDRVDNIWASGREGEQRVADLLTQMLNDDWTLLAGYCNPRGEIDQMLAGPGGLFALEIKYRNGVIHCDGDSWQLDKYDKYGNKVESGVAIADARGRSPSEQVNSAADFLQRFLERRTAAPPITRAIIFSHERSQLGQIRNPTVNFVGVLSKSSVQQMLSVAARSLDAALVQSIVAAIRSDHEFHKARRNRNSSN
jgi:hypothetical protein